MSMIDPTTEAYLATVQRTNRYIAFQNAVVVLSAGAALAVAAIHDSWLIAFVSLFLLGATKPFLHIPGTVKIVNPKHMRRIN